jgi:SAM-dependent methyltransferase
MMDYIYGREELWATPEATAIGTQVFNFTTQAPASEGVRSRRAFIAARIDRLADRVTATDLTPNAVSIARQHFALEGVQAEDIRTANALNLPFPDNTFDAVWANGVLHATGDTRRAIQEARRVLKPGGRAIISHFYRKPSWMYLLHHLGRENIEYKEEDPPVNEFYAEREILSFFNGFEVVEAVREHHRLLPVRRSGLKASLYAHVLKPVYNLLPESIAKKFAYKFSVTAIKV